LLNAGFIREVTYLQWLTNVVMVPKKNGKWRRCTDFNNLNKCCPKDNFPLIRTDKIVDSAVGCEMMVLLDCFSGYHQIWLLNEDEEKTSFITPFGTYSNIRMPEAYYDRTTSKMRGSSPLDRSGDLWQHHLRNVGSIL
jgi:hypothetical protein